MSPLHLDDLAGDLREQVEELIDEGGERRGTRPGATVPDAGEAARRGLRRQDLSASEEEQPTSVRSALAGFIVQRGGPSPRNWTDRPSAAAPIR